MSASSSHQSAPERCLLGDMLHALPSAARQTLFAALKSNSSLSAARLSSRVLRDFIDGHAPELKLDLSRYKPNELLPLCHEGRWLRRWPQCTAVTLLIGEEALGVVTLPFATAPPEACQRITSLKLQGNSLETVVETGTLLALTSRLPGRSDLRLLVSTPAADDDEEYETVQKPLTMYALSLLPKLRSFATDNWGYLSCLPDCLAGRLTRLEVAAQEMENSRPPVSELVRLLGRLTALKELVLRSIYDAPFSADKAFQLLDSALDTLQSMDVSPVGPEGLGLGLCFAAGSLQTANVRSPGDGWVPYAAVSEVLAGMLLPSRRLGPRLQLLQLGGVDVTSAPDPDPAAALYARCDKVAVEGLTGQAGAEEAAIAFMRLAGLPARLSWPLYLHVMGVVTLHRLRPGQARPAAGSSTRGVPLPPHAVLERALERVLAADGPSASTVLLRGPLLRGLAAVPAALSVWLGQVHREVPQAFDLRYAGDPARGWLYDVNFRVAVLPCGSPEAAAAVAAVVRRLAQAAASEDGGGAGAGAALLDVRLSCFDLGEATVQVLQALWDGEEGGVEEAGGAGAEAGAGGGNAPTSGACTPVELERVRCLMETWKGLGLVCAAGGPGMAQGPQIPV